MKVKVEIIIEKRSIVNHFEPTKFFIEESYNISDLPQREDWLNCSAVAYQHTTPHTNEPPTKVPYNLHGLLVISRIFFLDKKVVQLIVRS